MGKSMNGPDLLDVLAYIHTMDNEARSITTILVSPSGSLGGLPAHIVVHAVSSAAGIDGPVWSRSVSAYWPNRESSTFEGMLYRLVVELDKLISQAFEQGDLNLA